HHYQRHADSELDLPTLHTTNAHSLAHHPAYHSDSVNSTLVGNAPLAHTGFVDYDNSFAPNGNEPSSPPFNGPGNPAILVWAFSALQPGNWTYRCGMHPNSMTGKIQVLQEPRPVNLTFYGDAGQGWGFSNS